MTSRASPSTSSVSSTPLLPARKALEKALAERSLAEFVRFGWHVLEPGVPFTHGRVIDAICEHLEAVTSGQLTRLLINVPPGTAKSMLASVFWPMWEWGPQGKAHRRFLGFSYSDVLSTRDNRRSRNLLASDWYQGHWPVALAGDQSQKTFFENEHAGWRQASSVGGVGTGQRADRLIIDDPHNVRDGESEARLNGTLLWFNETLPTRVNDPKRSAIVVIMQRVHERDVSGQIIARELGYEHLMLPMRYEPERHCRTSIGFEDWRTREGELLFPERFPPEVLERDEKAMGSYAIASQMQQRPAPRGGGFLKVGLITTIEDWPRGARRVRRWDFAATAATGSNDPDWTVGALLAHHNGRTYILDIRRMRGSPHEVQQLVKRTAQQDGYEVEILLEQEPGSSGVVVVDHYTRNVLSGWTVRTNKVTGSKVQRAEPFAAAIEAGNVYMLPGAWNEAFLDEARVFPAGAHDDQVDAVADAHAHLARGADHFYVGTWVGVDYDGDGWSNGRRTTYLGQLHPWP